MAWSRGLRWTDLDKPSRLKAKVGGSTPPLTTTSQGIR